MNNPVIEVAVYKVNNPQTAAARRTIRPHIEAFKGFPGWQAVTSAGDRKLFTGILTWQTLEAAKAAGEKVMSDPICASFMPEIAEVVSMGHYV